MISRQHKKHIRHKTIQQFVLAVLFLVFVGFLNMTNRNPLTGVTHFLAVPILKIEENVRGEIVGFFSILKSKKSLVEENNALKQNQNDIDAVRIVNDALEAENRELKHLLGRDVEDNVILASVVTRPNVSPYDTIIIDVGTSDGIHVGDEVMIFGDFLAGFVSKVFTNSSQVTMFSSPGVKTNIFIGESGISAVSIGRGAGNFYSELPRDLEIRKNDVITLSSLDTQVFGEVETIIRGDADAFQTILFKSPVNINSIKRVQVVRSNLEL